MNPKLPFPKEIAILILCLANHVYLSLAIDAVVDLGYNLHQGFQSTTISGLDYYNFSNVRYAAAPTGQLRFQAPASPHENRSSIQTGQEPAICASGVQAWLTVASEVVGQQPVTFSAVPPYGPANYTGVQPGETEDCLVLDLLVPKTIFDNRNSSKAAVLLSIYASANTQGSKTFYGLGTGLLSRSVENGHPGLIYVAPNYRVGLFGFLAGKEALAQGEPNAALLDQRFAMDWVQKYIHLFGGDRDQVTMLGKSSGSGDVLAQVASYGGQQGHVPFKRALAQSAFLQYIPPTVAESTYETVLNYSGVTDFAALQEVPFETLHRANNLIIGQATPYGTFVFGPTVDGKFLPDDPPNLLLDGRYDKSVQMFTGLSSDEGLLLQSPFVQTNDDYDDAVKQLLPSANATTLEYITQTLYPPDFSGAFGYTNQTKRLDRTIGDYSIVCPTVYLDDAYRSSTSYAYEFTVFPGAHAQDLTYTFYYEGSPPDVGVPTAPPVNGTLAEIMQQYFTSYVETGIPDASGLPTFPSAEGGLAINFNSSYVGVVDDRGRFVDQMRCEWWQRGEYRAGV